MFTIKVSQLEKRIQTLKEKLSSLGPLRPGNLTKQYKDPKNKRGSFYQISYTHKMRSRTEYVRAENLKILEKEIAEYKRYRKLTEQFIDLNIELSKQKISELKKSKCD